MVMPPLRTSPYHPKVKTIMRIDFKPTNKA